MVSRRFFLQAGMSGVTLGLLTRAGLAGTRLRRAPGCPDTGAFPVDSTDPQAFVPDHPGPSVIVGGLPFAGGFFGDDFPNTQIPFHQAENVFPGGEPPPPTESIDVAVVGGGLSGLSTAYFLRHRRPVLFELHGRFGGNAQGEAWRDTSYSLGGAYFITPDEGSFLERFYHDLGLDHNHRLDSGPNPIELNGRIAEGFWSGAGRPPEEVAAFQQYARVVTHMANEAYPEIPLPEGENNQWILDLDAKTFKQDIEDQMGMPMPRLLAAGVQSYCYSSFNAGAEELSAAAGWNFLAAEEFGRWVCPGGNVAMMRALWDRLRENERHQRPDCPGKYLRAGCRVVDVRLAQGNRVQVTYRDKDHNLRSLLARKVVMCCPKHVAKFVIHDLNALDPDKVTAMWQLETRPYVVANVLLNGRMRHDLYDVFALGDGHYPTNVVEADAWWHFADVVDGAFARHGHPDRSVLTVYWPLPSNMGRRRLIAPDGWQQHADRVAPQISSVLGLYGFEPSDVVQVRMARWGHAMPIPVPGTIADGKAEKLRRPIEDKIYFANQDNWALPAVENSVLDARHYATIIDHSL